MTKSEDARAKRTKEPALANISQGSSDHPRAFLSYAWTSDEHIERVRTLADLLIAKGIDVLLDVYENRPGHDLDAFMERTVTDRSIGFVLVVSDKNYADKADGRLGGVGTETQLISHELYERIDQEKVVPLIFEKDEEGKPYRPAYMRSRHYIDFTNPDKFEISLDELVRHVYRQPKFVKPKLGHRPDFESESAHPATTIPRQRTDVGFSSILDARDDFIGHLKSTRAAGTQDMEIDDVVVERIESAQPYLKNLLIQLDRFFLTNKDDDGLINLLDGLLSEAKAQQAPLPGVSSWRETDYEHIGFLVQELAMSVVALLIKHKRFALVHRLINHTYFYDTHYGEQRAVTFEDFYAYNGVLDRYRNERLNLRRVSVSADMHREHASHFEVIDFEQLLAADSLLHLLTRFQFPTQDRDWWFPKLSVYATRHSNVVSPMGQLVSKERANEIVKMFGAKDLDDFLKKYEDAKEQTRDIPYGASREYNTPSFERMLPDKIAELP